MGNKRQLNALALEKKMLNICILNKQLKVLIPQTALQYIFNQTNF